MKSRWSREILQSVGIVAPLLCAHRYAPMIDWREHITADPAILVGKPAVRGTRLSLEFILGLFAEGWSAEEVLRNYPQLQTESLAAVFAYAAEAVRLLPPLSDPDPE